MDEEEKEDRESASMHSSTWLDKDCLFLSIWSNKFAKSPPLHVFGPTMAIEWQLFVILFCSPSVLTSCRLEYSTPLPVSLSCLAINMYEYRNVVRHKVYLKCSKVYTRDREIKMARQHSLTHNNQPVHISTLHMCSFFLSPFLRRVHILNSQLAYTFITIEVLSVKEWMAELRKEYYIYPFEFSFIATITCATCFFPTVSKSIHVLLGHVTLFQDLR